MQDTIEGVPSKSIGLYVVPYAVLMENRPEGKVPSRKVLPDILRRCS